MSKWVRTPGKDHAQIRLICFPPAGLGASFFHQWHALAAPEVEVCAAQLRGREDRIRESPFTSLTPLLAELRETLVPLIQAPYAFFGHSFGAQVAFELARDIQHSGLPGPRHLFVSAGRAPQLRPRMAPITQLDDNAFLTLVQLRYDAIPRELLNDAELTSLLARTLKADFRILEMRQNPPGPPLDCPITAFGGATDDTVLHFELDGWRQQTRQRFRLEIFPGGHFFAREIPGELLCSIQADLIREAFS